MPMPGNHTEFGSLSFFINDPKEHDISDEEIASLGETIARHYSELIAKSEFRDVIKVSRIGSKRGCIIITLHLAVAVTVAGGGVSVIEILKNYPKIRKGAIDMGKDLNKLRLTLKRLSRELKVWFYRDDIDDDDRD